MHQEKKYLNIACGSTFINDDVWTNIDFTSNSPRIKKADILNGMPFKDNEFDVIYSSHFIEHIPKEDVTSFLKDVFRILKQLMSEQMHFAAQFNGICCIIQPTLL